MCTFSGLHNWLRNVYILWFAQSANSDGFPNDNRFNFQGYVLKVGRL
jgi:hypothetical protein